MANFSDEATKCAAELRAAYRQDGQPYYTRANVANSSLKRALKNVDNTANGNWTFGSGPSARTRLLTPDEKDEFLRELARKLEARATDVFGSVKSASTDNHDDLVGVINDIVQPPRR